MKIVLVGNYLSDMQHSMLRFCATLGKELRRAGHEVRVIHPPTRLGADWNIPNHLAKWFGYLDKFIFFLPELRRQARAADVVHICDHAYSLYTRFLVGIPRVVTCHDLLATRCALGEFRDQRVGWSGREYQRLILKGLERASFVGCDSVATRSDILRLTKVPKERTALIHVGFNFPYGPASGSERKIRLKRLGLGLNDPFLIHVGTNVWYKNLPGVIGIFSRLIAGPEANDLHLVMVGNGWTDELDTLVNKSELTGKVTRLSNVSSEDLRALYSGACGLLFPSLCEGFGWPIIEAQACGCPVFASDRPPMTEVGGEGAVYFDPENYDQAADVIRRRLYYRSEIRAAGFVNARRFSAANTAAAYIRLYFDAIILEGAGRSRRDKFSAQ
jgi:glycosyltransferase involved in cell wall biosynthesis